MVYIEQVLIYEPPTSATATPVARGSALYTRAAAIESTAFVRAAAAPLLARGVVTPKQVAQATVRAEVQRQTDLIEIRVEHPDPKIAQMLGSGLIDEAMKTARVTPSSAASQPADPQAASLAQTPGQVATPFCVIQDIAPASQLTPHFTPLNWAVFFIANFTTALVLLLTFRRRIFGTNAE
jgi:hypothetical protein